MKLRALFLVLFSASAVCADEPALPPVKADIEFAKAGDVSLTLDAFVPDGAGPFPTCILVHGGGFTTGTKRSFIAPLFEPLSKAGFTWFTINYRLAPQHQWPACADDVASAIKWVKAHASEYKVDTGRIALIGESAGAHLVSWAGVQGKGDLAVAAVVPYYTPNDLVTLIKGRKALGNIGLLAGMTELNEAAWQKLAEMSPSTYVRLGLPPFLLIHGDKDEKVPYEQSTLFQQLMQKAGNTCDLITVPGGGHGMGGWQKLNTNYQQQMIDWLKKTLK